MSVLQNTNKWSRNLVLPLGGTRQGVGVCSRQKGNASLNWGVSGINGKEMEENKGVKVG